MLEPDGAPGPALTRRTRHAAALYAAGRAGTVVATGGPAGAHPTEARVMRDLLVATGVPATAVIEEDRARNTLENALFSVDILRARGFGPAIVVTDRYHLPRALMLFRLLGWPATGSGPARGGPVDPGWRLDSLRREAVALPRDLARGLAARLRGG
jgi:uncharacterized SAM-binding protein YcdF (DUF218 family)